MPKRAEVGRWLARASALAIVAATLTPTPSARQPSEVLCVMCGEFGAADAVLNVLLFLPLGAGLALAGGRPVHVLAMGLASVGIEILQLLVVPGRHAAAGDILTNTAGGALGFLIGIHLDALLRPRARIAAALLGLWSVAWLTVHLVAGYALLPAPTISKYYGQVARELDGLFVAFPGSVLNPMVGGLPVPDWDLPAADSVRVALKSAAGAGVSAIVVPHACPTSLAAILRIADAESREIVLLAQDQGDLVFGVRTGADALRLRPVRFRLSGVFGPDRRCVHQPDTVVLEGWHGRGAVQLRATGRGRVLVERTPLYVFEGWRLFMPFGHGQRGMTAALWTALWLFVLVMPAGYLAAWLAAAKDHGGGATGARIGGVALLSGLAFVVALLLGFFAIPAAFGLPGATWRHLFAALAGFASGGLIARPMRHSTWISR